MDEKKALEVAVEAAQHSPCAKSKRGVVIFARNGGVISARSNAPPPGFMCDGSEACRANCAKVAVHAEQAAILDAHTFGKPVRWQEMLHIKVVDNKPVAGGPPSCPDCSKLILEAGIAFMWLLEVGADGLPVLVKYTAHDFHAKTLENCKLHVALTSRTRSLKRV